MSSETTAPAVEITREGDSIWVNDTNGMIGRWTLRGCSIRDEAGTVVHGVRMTRTGFAVAMAAGTGGQQSDFR